MKKISISLLTLPLMLTLFSCENTPSKVKLIYGSLCDETATSITYEQYSEMVGDEQSFIIAMTPDCGCLGTFTIVLDAFVNENPHIIYTITNVEIGDNDSFGLPVYDQKPTFAIFDKGKIKYTQVYDEEYNTSVFLNQKTFTNYILENTIQPLVNYIDKTQLDEHISNNDEFLILYSRNTCPDCTYLNRHGLKEYLDVFEENLDTNFYIIDCDVEGIRYNAQGEYDESQWVAFKNSYGLSNVNDSTFGYDVGYVPTIQVRKGEQIQSAFVYLNDELSKNEDNSFYVSRSFFDEDRLPHLKYLEGIENNIIEGIKIPEENVNIAGEYMSWVRDAADVYYLPLLNAFLDYYLR